MYIKSTAGGACAYTNQQTFSNFGTPLAWRCPKNTPQILEEITPHTHVDAASGRSSSRVRFHVSMLVIMVVYLRSGVVFQ